jgi:putative spermidine/putrescine transport system permease protein
MFLMYGYPFLSSITRSFINSQGQFSFENYQKTVDLYLKDIGFTFAVTVFSTAVSAGLAILLAVYLRLRQNSISRVLGGLYRLPIFIPFVAKVGIVDIKNPLQLFNFYGLTFGFIWKMIPFSVLIIHGGFQMIDNSYIEAARSCGAGLMRVITRVLIPMNRSSIVVALVLVYSQIVGTFTLPYMLIGGKIPTTITVDIAHRINYFRDFGVANTLGVFSYLLVLATAVYYLKSSVKKVTGSQASER